MITKLTRLDHVVIAVKNLDAAAATYRKLGFTLTPRGLHEGKGTGNHCIMFPNTYVELLGIVDETGAKGRLAERVNARGEGGMAIAYGADDADETYAALRAAGIEAEPPNDLSRPLDLDGKRDMVRFRNIMLPKLALPETMQFVCTHVTPELTRARREWQLHPSGATGVAEVVIAADDPAAARRELAGPALKNSAVTLLTPADAERRFGKSLQGTPKHGIVALTIRVNEPDAAAAMLSMAKVPHHETRNTVTVPAHSAHGVVIEFAED
jgi:catechol 2,3-dioxygenase-like lactoylglutathione lyase family enzyme